MRIPPSITAGDTPAWLDNAFADGLGNPVDATGYTLTYALRGPTLGAGLDLVGVPQGTGWAFSLTTAQSAALNTGATPARWFWQAYAAKTGGRLTAGTGQLMVQPNLLALAPGVVFDGRSQAEQILSIVEAAIQARASGDMVTEYTIGSRSLKKEPMTELLALRSRYRTICSRERKAQSIKNGLGNPTRLGVRFKQS